MQAPVVTVYSNGAFGVSHLMRYCLEYEVWAAKGPVDMATLARTLAVKYRSHYQKSNLVTRLTEMMGRGRVHRVSRGLYVHDAHMVKFEAELTAQLAQPVDIFS